MGLEWFKEWRIKWKMKWSLVFNRVPRGCKVEAGKIGVECWDRLSYSSSRILSIGI